MCGFAGVVSFDEQFRITRETLASMAGCIAHRGPDGRGLHLADTPASSAALAHVRLAILDPDPRSDQPFRLGTKWIVYNGEIYNFRELRAELDRTHPGHPWRTTGDTEVLLRAYDVWGPACLPKLDGMFAFAVWDESDGSVFLARDRMGQKPLYYAIAPGSAAVAFSSELSAFQNLPWPDRTIDPTALTHYLSWGYIPAPLTIYQGIHKLPHSHSLKILPHHTHTPTRYYDINAAAPDSSFRNPQSAIRNLFSKAVSRQLVSDVPVGCFLSGGIDSSITALCMKRSVPPGQRVMTFSIGFDDPRYDETPYAREVAEHLGTEHHEFRVTPDAAADFPRLASVYGEPFADSSALPTHYLARETRRHVKVALSGDGGDELFGGYDRYRAMRLAERLRAAAPVLRGVAGAIPGVHPKSAGARAKRFARSVGLPPADRYASYMRLFTSDEIEVLTNATGAEAAVAQWFRQEFNRLHADRDVVETALAVDRDTYLPEDLFTKVDRASMLHALEVRSPFMDPDVLALASRLRTDQLLAGGGKRMLREAFAADLPADVFRRRKMGFAVPIGDWFRTTLRPMLRDLLLSSASFAATHLNTSMVRRLLEEHDRRTADHAQRLYALLMLELWWRQAAR